MGGPHLSKGGAVGGPHSLRGGAVVGLHPSRGGAVGGPRPSRGGKVTKVAVSFYCYIQLPLPPHVGRVSQ